MGQVASRIKTVFSINEEQNVPINTGTEETAVLLKDKIRFKNIEIKSKLATPRKPLKRSFSQIIDSAIPQSIIEIFKPKRIRLDLETESVEPEFLDFPFLKDQKSINYFRKSKIMFLMRGLPGSGKSTVIEALRRKFNSFESCSADDFFMVDGRYEYEGTKIGEAHQHCQLKAIDCVQKQIHMIAIDNTNIQFWEMKFYFDLAQEYNYLPIIVEPQTPWKMDLEILEQKNSHGINKDILKFKLDSMKEHFPLYCGWFLNERDSFLIRDQASWWLNQAYKHQLFEQDCKYYYGINSSAELEYLYPELNSCSLLHCTSKYIGRGRSEECEKYLKSVNFQNALNRVFDLEIYGYIFTPRTVGARIRLNEEEIVLWAGNDVEEIPEYFYVDKEQEESSIHNGEDSISSEEIEVATNGIDLEECDNLNLDDKEHSKGVNDEDILVKDHGVVINGNGVVSNGHEDIVKKQRNCDDLSDTCKVNGAKNKTGEFRVNDSKTNGVHTNGDINMVDVALHQNGKSDAKGKLTSDESPSAQNGDIRNGLSSNSCEIPKSPFKSPKKSPRKHKNKIISIPPNERHGADSSTATFLRFESNDYEKSTKITKGIRAHLTLGCADEVSKVTTGLDALFTNLLEQESNAVPIERGFETDGGKFSTFGNGVWVAYPKEKMFISSLFVSYG